LSRWLGDPSKDAPVRQGPGSGRGRASKNGVSQRPIRVFTGPK